MREGAEQGCPRESLRSEYTEIRPVPEGQGEENRREKIAGRMKKGKIGVSAANKVKSRRYYPGTGGVNAARGGGLGKWRWRGECTSK